MSTNNPQPPARRILLRRMGGASGAALEIPPLFGGLATSPASAQDATHAADEKSRRPTYPSLGPQEAVCVEALVNVMCPADALTPSGVDCGLHVYIDRRLAGAWGRGDQLYRQGPWHPGEPQHGENALAAFLSDPQQAVPGNRMPFAGVPDPGELAELVKYLKTL